jgi:phosphoribosyl 1,2-cyclic phosphodiesterase
MSDRQQFLVRFWGVRGSYPTPGPHTLRHGGNTACVEVQVGGQRLIFDAGSGIIGLGNTLVLHESDQESDKEQLDVTLFITHGHGDHLLGFPFFAPLFDTRTHIHLFGPDLAGHGIEKLVTSLMSPPYFPVDLRKLPSHRTFHTVTGEEDIIWHKGSREPHMNGHRRDYRKRAKDEVKVRTQFTTSHPLNGAVLYRIEYAGHSAVYATDVEWRAGIDPDFLRFVEGADLLIHDAQYTTHDYEHSKQGFGHSTVEMAIEAAQAAHVQQLILFHHEPTYDDNQLDAMEAEAQSQFPRARSAREGMEIDLLEGQNEV